MASGKMPKLKNCIQCGKIFYPTRGEKLCRDCLQKEQDLEIQVMQYIRDNPNISAKEVMEATGASDKLIQKMAREGMFVNTASGNSIDFFYPCVGCGRPIRTGTYCTDCLARLRNETKKVAEAMHIRIREDKKMSTIERLNALAEREFEKENQVVKRHFSRGMYEDLADSRR